MLISQQEQLFNFTMDYCFQDQLASIKFCASSLDAGSMERQWLLTKEQMR